ncbi:MAG: hypothetical protein U0271_06700 [Polyangiaceae bacterium]
MGLRADHADREVPVIHCRASLALAALSLTISIGASRAAHAQTDAAPPEQRARQLVKQGKKLMADGRAAEACPRFEEAVALAREPETLLELGSCYEATERAAQAIPLYDEVASDPSESTANLERAIKSGDAIRHGLGAAAPARPVFPYDVTAPEVSCAGVATTADGAAPDPVRVYVSGRCAEENGKIAAAYRAFNSIAALPSAPPRLVERAAAAVKRIEPRLPRLTVSLLTPADGAVVSLDGSELPADALGRALFVDPGRHRLAVEAPCCVATIQDVALAEGEARAVELVLVGYDTRPTDPNPPSRATPSLIGPEVIAGLVISGGGLASLAIFGGLYAAASGKEDDLDALASCSKVSKTSLECSNPSDVAAARQLATDGENLDVAATAMFVSGLSAIAVGAVFFAHGLVVGAEKQRAAAPTITLAPMVGPRSAGLFAVGVW